MAKMDDKDLKVTGTAWGVIFAISLYGGLARYIIDNKRNGYRWSWLGAIMQMMVSGFSGLMGGLLSVELNASFYYTVFAAGKQTGLIPRRREQGAEVYAFRQRTSRL